MKALLQSANLHLAHITLLMANASRGATVCFILLSPHTHLQQHTASHTVTGAMPAGCSASVWSASRCSFFTVIQWANSIKSIQRHNLRPVAAHVKNDACCGIQLTGGLQQKGLCSRLVVISRQSPRGSSLPLQYFTAFK